jgi:hypothetical protein
VFAAVAASRSRFLHTLTICFSADHNQKTLSSKPRGSESVDYKSTLLSVIPAQAGIQAVFELEPEPNLDAGFHRHYELSLRLKARDFNHPRKTLTFRRDHIG